MSIVAYFACTRTATKPADNDVGRCDLAPRAGQLWAVRISFVRMTGPRTRSSFRDRSVDIGVSTPGAHDSRDVR